MGTDISKYFPIIDLDREFLQLELKNPGHKKKYEAVDISEEFNTDEEDFTLAFSPELKAAIAVFNDDDDEDDLKNFDKPPFEELDNPAQAMLRYDLFGQLKASGSSSLKKLKIEFDTSQKIGVHYYKVHDGGTKLLPALVEDLKDFRFIFSSEHIKSLKANDALAFHYDGHIGAGVELTLSDVYSAALSSICELLPEKSGIDLNFKAGLTFGAEIKISDTFKIFIRKNTEADKFTLSITKAKTNNLGLNFKAGITASLEIDSDLFKSFLGDLIDAVLGKSLTEVENLLNQGIGSLSDSQKQVLQFIIDRLEWNIDLDDVELFKSKLDDLKDWVQTKAEEAIKEELEASFSLEYKRTSSKETLIEATLSADHINKDNVKSMIFFNPDKFYQIEGIDYQKFLLNQNIQIARGTKFSFKLGKLEAYWKNGNEYNIDSSFDRLTDTYTNTFSAQRKHAHERSAETESWSFGMTATLEQGSGAPKMAELDYEYYLQWKSKQRKTKKEELEEFVDMLMIWNCIDQDKFKEVFNKLDNLIQDQRGVEYKCEFKVSKDISKDLLAKLASRDNSLVHLSLAEAVPYLDKQFRRTLSSRGLMYNSIWQRYIAIESDPKLAYKYADELGNYLKTHDAELARYEGKFNTKGIPKQKSFVALCEFNTVNILLNSLHKGASMLHNQITNTQSPYNAKILKNSFEKMDNIVATAPTHKTFNLNFMARYLYNTAKKKDLLDGLNCYAEVKYKDQQSEEQTISFARGKQ